MKVRFKRLSYLANVPTRAHGSDAGFDLYAVSSGFDNDGCLVCHTGIAVEIPNGYMGLVFPRSSIARTGLMLTNSVGVIDSGYRGEILLKFRIVDVGLRIYDTGDRVGQLVVMPYPEIEYVESDELSDSDRGSGGYGSSGR